MLFIRDGKARDLIKTLQDQGWVVTQTQKSHWRFCPPDPKKRIVITSGSPGDVRGFKNLVRDLRHSGAKIP